MVSSQRMGMIGIIWIACMTLLALFAYIGGIFIHKMVVIALTTVPLNPAVPLDSLGWLETLYYAVIFFFAIAVTYRCYQETVSVTDYFPDTGVY